MMKKRILAVIMATSMVASVLSGCGSNAAGDGTESGTVDTATSEDGEKVQLSALIAKHSLTKDVTEMEWLNMLNEELGIEMEWQQISADWDQKKPVMFAGGDIPDILIKATAVSDFVTYNGLFEDLVPYIESGAMPNVQKMFEDHPELKIMCTNEDGEIYGLPNYRSIWPRTNRVLYINKTWLDNLGLEVPETMDELEEVMIAFNENDANQNGDATDEIAMDFNGFPTFLLACFGVPMMNESEGYYVEDGQVQNYRVTEEYKEFMKWLQKLNSEGLLNEEILTQDYSKFQATARGENGVAKVGVTLGWESGDRFGTEVADQYIALGALKPHVDSDESKVYWGYYSDNNSVNAATVALSSNCDNKDKAVEFIDSLYEEKTSLEVLFGGMNEVDGCVQDNGDGTYTVLPPADSSIDPGTWKWTNSFADYSPYYIPDNMKDRLTMGSDMERVNQEREALESTLDYMEETCETYPSKFINYTTDETESLSLTQANIDNVVSETYAAWLSDASISIDDVWEDYLSQMEAAGLSENIAVRQAAYERYVEQVE